ncbi:hypothetical protein [Parachitinimonas caeni]|uniref:Lipoprotein n=1 Tax=Parachitinimonas caeni TaxID=3031301 RepID=A0ABT7DRS3_9NEIS|nr:hypothetical protein [Parachitinimonas caeni]MDK2122766.1 hypothetical protein [Parachitinimonas caeni]
MNYGKQSIFTPLLSLCASAVFLQGCNEGKQSEENSTDYYIQRISAAAEKAWPSLDAIWGGVNEKDAMYRNLVLVVADGRQAWEIDRDGSRPISYEKISARQLPNEYGTYQKLENWREGRFALFISLGETLDQAELAKIRAEPAAIPFIFTLATHEAMHYYLQDKWQLDGDKASRSTRLPIAVEPRVLRNHLARSLERAAQGNLADLGHASYWYQKWKQQYPEEVLQIHWGDIVEGSATYIEMVAETIAKGHAFGSSQYHAAVNEKIQQSAEVIPDIALESYRLGALAGHLLDRQGRQWKSQVEKDQSPLDILLHNIAPVPEALDLQLERELKLKIAQQSQEAEDRLGIFKFVENIRQANTAKVFIPNSKMVVSELAGLYSIADFAYEITGYSAQVHLTGGSLTAKSATMAMISDLSYCGEPGGLFVLPNGMPDPDQGRLKFSSAQLSMDVPYPVLDASGKVYCLR